MKLIYLAILTMTCFAAPAQSGQIPESTLQKDKAVIEESAVKHVIERFLIAVGNYDIDSLTTMFTDNANISGSSFRNGIWSNYTVTAQEFLTRLRSTPVPKKYSEPVNHWTIHIDEGRLAFVRADATLFIEGKAQRHNIDYFILIKEKGLWKILNGSYVSVPLEPGMK